MALKKLVSNSNEKFSLLIHVIPKQVLPLWFVFVCQQIRTVHWIVFVWKRWTALLRWTCWWNRFHQAKSGTGTAHWLRGSWCLTTSIYRCSRTPCTLLHVLVTRWAIAEHAVPIASSAAGSSILIRRSSTRRCCSATRLDMDKIKFS